MMIDGGGDDLSSVVQYSSSHDNAKHSDSGATVETVQISIPADRGSECSHREPFSILA